MNLQKEGASGDYLANLNEKQKEAVSVLKGPLMIIAGAGSGKTKVLTSRIANLMAHGVDPFRIMALTFTNKAAAEIRNRIESYVGNTESRNIYAGTFHSIFARILRVEGTHLGYTSSFTIYDAEDSKSVLKKTISGLNLDNKQYKVNSVYNRISHAKNELVTPEEYELDEIRKNYDEMTRMPRIWEIYKLYSEQCFKNNAMDFDDILLNTYRLFQRFPEILHKYQHKILHILIDEFQDTNPLQYAIIKKLSVAHENICVVGDDAQSIYSFRGATIDNILRFKKDYPDVKIIKLEQNYRSHKHILDLANGVIKRNKNQIEKNLWTSKTEGEKARLYSFSNENEEARMTVQSIMEMQYRNHIPGEEIAVLYRTNAQSRTFEEHLRRNNIPYVIYGGFSFYQRKEVKDFLSYLRIILNPNDNESLARIINYPARGIGETSLNKYLLFAYENNVSLFHIFLNIGHFENRNSHVSAIKEFIDMIHFFQAEATKKNAYDLAVTVAKETKMRKEFFDDKTPEGIARYENLEELLNSIKSFIDDASINDEHKDLAAYLQQVSLVSSSDEKKEDNRQAVKLMTIHAAKGLEFECVFVVGMQEGVFPSVYSSNSREELEEERRLFYVAITRAKKYLWISYAHSRYVHGTIESTQESRFISELDPNSIVGSPISRQQSAPQERKKSFGVSYKKLIKDMAAMKPSHQPSTNFSPSTDFSNYTKGARIEHDQFGFGTIAQINDTNNNLLATIDFDKFGEKKIMLRYAKTQLVKE